VVVFEMSNLIMDAVLVVSVWQIS